MRSRSCSSDSTRGARDLKTPSRRISAHRVWNARRRPDERRGRRHRDEPESLEDRSTIVGGVDLDEVKSADSRQIRPVLDGGTVDPPSAPSRQRAAAPQRCELRSLFEPHPASADDLGPDLDDPSTPTPTPPRSSHLPEHRARRGSDSGGVANLNRTSATVALSFAESTSFGAKTHGRHMGRWVAQSGLRCEGGFGQAGASVGSYGGGK